MVLVLVRLERPGDAGRLALALAVCAPVMMLADMSLEGVLAVDAAGRHRFGEYLAFRLLTTAGGLAVIAGLTAALAADRRLAVVVLLVGVTRAVESLSSLAHGLLRQRERMARAGAGLALRGVLSLVAFSAGLALAGPLEWAALGLVAGRAVTLVAWDLPGAASVLRAEAPAPSAATLRPLWNGRALAGLAAAGLPLGLVMLLGALAESAPRWVVHTALGEAALGVFAAVAYPAMVADLAVRALAEAASPRLARLWARGERRAWASLTARLVWAGGLAGGAGLLVAAVAGGPILARLYGPGYGASAGLLTWLMLAAGARHVAAFLSTAITAAWYFRVQVPLLAAVALTAGTGSAWLAPAAGLGGVAAALVLAGLVHVAGAALVLRHALAPSRAG